MEQHVFVARHCVLMAVLIAAAYTDVAHRRIPNWLTLSGILAGLFLNFALGGIWDDGAFGANLGSSLLAAAVSGLVFLWPYLKGGIGGGDVKLMVAVGCLGGMHRGYIVYALFYSALIGALLAVLVLIWHRRLWEGLKSSLLFVVTFRKHSRLQEGASEPSSHLTVPYGAAIAVGSILAWCMVELQL